MKCHGHGIHQIMSNIIDFETFKETGIKISKEDTRHFQTKKEMIDDASKTIMQSIKLMYAMGSDGKEEVISIFGDIKEFLKEKEVKKWTIRTKK